MTELLCIETHRERVVVAGQTYQMLGERVSPCCGIKEVDIGVIYINMAQMECTVCGKVYCATDGINWLRASRFAQIGTEDECEQYREKVLIENQPAGAK